MSRKVTKLKTKAELDKERDERHAMYKRQREEMLRDYGPREDTEAWKAFQVMKLSYEWMVSSPHPTANRKKLIAATWFALSAMQELSGGGVPIHYIRSEDMPKSVYKEKDLIDWLG